MHLKIDAIMHQLPMQDPSLYDTENRNEVEDELITPSSPDAVPTTEGTIGIFLGPSEAFPDDLDELPLADLQGLHSRICRQLEHDYRTIPAGPPWVTLERYHDLVVELDRRHTPQAP